MVTSQAAAQDNSMSTLLTTLYSYVKTLLIAENLLNPSLLWVTANQRTLMQIREQLARIDNKSYGTEKRGKIENAVVLDNVDFTTLTALAKETVLTRYSLVCFWLPDLGDEDMSHYLPLIMRYRDLYAEHMLVLTCNDIQLQAYGLTPLDRLSDIPLALTLWQFNLYDYKQLPPWLNSKYWANPEQWNKRRW